MTSFTELVRGGSTAEEIAAHLDGLSAAQRVEEVLALPGGLQEKLWKIVEGQRVELDQIVDVEGETLIYELKNSLPLFNISQKRFFKPAEGEVVGYNHTTGLAKTFAGPGYFFVQDGKDGLEFDYTRLPTLQPEGWPEIKPNTGLIPGATYGNMIDYCRRLSKHSLIGEAWKKGKPMGAYFMLTRCVAQS
ncbi:MAG: hypothetical protein RIT81_28080 [Deltaproteobacteria bacterium]